MEIRIEEDIKFIDEMVKEYNTFGDLDNPDYEDTERIYKAIENILLERKQDKKKIKELEEALLKVKDKNIKLFMHYKNSIPVQKVKDKIEEYKKIQDEMTIKNHNADNINDCYKYGDEAQKAMHKKEALQELLEDK